MTHLEAFITERRNDVAAYLRRRLLMDQDLVEDAIQDACIRAIQKIRQDPLLDSPRITRLFWVLARRAGQHALRKENVFAKWVRQGFDQMVTFHAWDPEHLHRLIQGV